MNAKKSRLQKSMEEQKATEKEFKEMSNRLEIALLDTPEGGALSFERMMKRSSFGELTEEMKKVVGSYVKGHMVFDLGAGDLSLSKTLLTLGARKVCAIDKEELHDPRQPIEGINFFNGYFDEFLKLNPNFRPSPNAVAFLSWPANHKMDGLLEILRRFKTIIYLGCNTGGSSCAWPTFFHTMYMRPVLAHVPYKRNTLIVWGKHDPTHQHRDLCLEEHAGGSHRLFEFEEGK